MNETGSLRVSPAGALLGELTVPGDKSVSHRAVMLGARAEEMVTVDGFGASADTLATIDAFRRMGVRIDHPEPGHLVINCVGLRGLRPPDGPIDVGNAGTLIRLLPGILAGQQGEFVLDGDESIRRCRWPRWGWISRPPTATRRSPSAGAAFSRSTTGRRSLRPRSSPACSWPACTRSGG